MTTFLEFTENKDLLGYLDIISNFKFNSETFIKHLNEFTVSARNNLQKTNKNISPRMKFSVPGIDTKGTPVRNISKLQNQYKDIQFNER